MRALDVPFRPGGGDYFDCHSTPRSGSRVCERCATLRLLPGHDLKLITAIGRHGLARRPSGTDVFIFDPKPLLGIWPDIGDYGSDEIAIQDSLF